MGQQITQVPVSAIRQLQNTNSHFLLDVRLSVFCLLTARELLRHVSDACSLSLVLYTKYLSSVCIHCLDVMLPLTSPQHMTAT